MRKYIALIILFFLTQSFLKSQDSISQYINALKGCHFSPKEYIFKLFETNDIVILGERDHRDTTQYDLILDILADEYFINNVGHVYTEVGAVNRIEWANKVLKEQYENDADFEKALIQLYRELEFYPLWEKYNMYKYLKGIYNINKTLNNDKKITVGLLDCEFDWEGMTAEKYAEFEKTDGDNRDSVMAFNFFRYYDAQKPINANKKALVILNEPHAVKIDIIYNSKKYKKSGSYINDKYGDNAKIVLLNWCVLGKNQKLVESGKWDAAFELTGKNPVGFNLKNNCFGISKHYSGATYEEIADGLIYYKPFYEFKCTAGISNVVDDGFIDELVRRHKVIYSEDSEEVERMRTSYEEYKEDLTEYFNKIRTFQCFDCKEMKKQMEKWLK